MVNDSLFIFAFPGTGRKMRLARKRTKAMEGVNFLTIVAMTYGIF